MKIYVRVRFTKWTLFWFGLVLLVLAVPAFRLGSNLAVKWAVSKAGVTPEAQERFFKLETEDTKDNWPRLRVVGFGSVDALFQSLCRQCEIVLVQAPSFASEGEERAAEAYTAVVEFRFPDDRGPRRVEIKFKKQPGARDWFLDSPNFRDQLFSPPAPPPLEPVPIEPSQESSPSPPRVIAGGFLFSKIKRRLVRPSSTKWH